MTTTHDQFIDRLTVLEFAKGMAQLPADDNGQLDHEASLSEGYMESGSQYLVTLHLEYSATAKLPPRYSPSAWFGELADGVEELLKELRALECGCKTGQWSRQPLKGSND